MTARFSAGRVKLLGTGSALPGSPIDNATLLASLEQHCGKRHAKIAGKIAQRLGIESRYVSRELESARSGARPGCDAPTLCRQAIESATNGETMSYLIGHTSTPHTLLPPNIAWVAEGLRFSGPYLELRQACTGFGGALAIAAAMIAENENEQIGIVGSENGSPFFDISTDFADQEQLVNYVQMGDGAGAVVLGSADSDASRTISDMFTGQIGIDRSPGIHIEGGGSSDPSCPRGLPFFRHAAGDVRRNGVSLFEAGIAAIRSRGYELADFDWIIPHQATARIGEQFAERYPETTGKVFVTADTLGNLGSAAIWISFDRLLRSAKIADGHKVLILGAEASKYLYAGYIYQH